MFLQCVYWNQGHPDNENQPDCITKTIHSNTLKSSQCKQWNLNLFISLKYFSLCPAQFIFVFLNSFYLDSLIDTCMWEWNQHNHCPLIVYNRYITKPDSCSFNLLCQWENCTLNFPFLCLQLWGFYCQNPFGSVGSQQPLVSKHCRH